ncbi:MAG TPA: hypothetical protein VKK31_13455 [Thermoanaerobaculia bacterium]|nr:hypothetical protein [Thermoanaerobaculia bacterium]
MRSRNPFLPVFLLALTLGLPEAVAQGKPQKAPANTQEQTPGKTPDKPKPAGETKNPYAERFEQLDRNKDGYVTLPEWPLEEASFHVVDRNKDGRLSRKELLTPNVLRVDPTERLFLELDVNRDGRLSRPERQRGGTGLDGLDRNKDGYVTPLEYRDGAVNVWTPRASYQDQQRFQNLDRDRDNRLTRPEWLGAGAAFDQADRNRDGVITPNEWPR